MKKIPIKTDKAPTPTGPFKPGPSGRGNFRLHVRPGGPQIAKTGQMGDIQDQARRCIANLSGVLEAAGSSLAQVVKATIFMKNPEDWKAFNEVYVELMPQPLPARSSVFANLKSPDMLLEMEVVAIVAD